MRSIFIDSSVLVAASGSTSGASAFILGLCRTGKIRGYVSTDVISEAKKNVSQKFGSIETRRLDEYLRKARLVIVPPAPAEAIAVTEKVINPKDAPILASAVLSDAKTIISLDKKHFFTKQAIDFSSPKDLMMPKDFVKENLGF